MKDLFFDATSWFYLPIIVALIIYTIKNLKQRNPIQGIPPFIYFCFCVAVVGATLFFSLQWELKRSLFALEFSIGLLLSLFDAKVAVCFLVANVILRPWELSDEIITSMAVIPKLMGGVCTFSWIYHGVKTKSLRILWDKPTRYFLGLAIWIFIAALTSGNADQGLTSYSNSFLIAAIIFLLVSNIISDLRDLRMMQFTICTAVAGVVAVAILRTWDLRIQDPSARLEGFGLLTGNANDLAALIVMAFPLLAVNLFSAQKRSVLKLLLPYLTLTIFLLGLWYSESRGAFMALLLSVACYFLLKMKDKKKAILTGAFLIPIALISLSAINMLRKSTDVSESTESRLNYVLAGINMAIHNPILGVGFDNYPRSFESYAPEIEYEYGERTAHNSWVLIMAETGFIGLFLLVALFFTTMKKAWRARQEFPELFLSMTGYGVAMSFLSHTYLFFPYLLYGLVLGGAKVKMTNGSLTAVRKE